MRTQPRRTRSPACHPAHHPAHKAFTLIEVLIVVVILALLATMTVPRLTGTTKRTFDLSVDRVGDLLLMFAQRDLLGQKPVGLMQTDNRIELVVLDAETGGYADWVRDPSVAPVKLPREVDADSVVVYADGEMVDIRSWPLSHTPGDDRPSIEISMQSIDGEHSATLVLSPQAVVPRRVDDHSSSGAVMSIDLDAAGRSREEW